MLMAILKVLVTEVFMSEVRKIISLVDSAYVHMLDAIMDVSCNLCLQKISAEPEGPRCKVSGMTGHICRYCCLFSC